MLKLKTIFREKCTFCCCLSKIACPSFYCSDSNLHNSTFIDIRRYVYFFHIAFASSFSFSIQLHLGENEQAVQKNDELFKIYEEKNYQTFWELATDQLLDICLEEYRKKSTAFIKKHSNFLTSLLCTVLEKFISSEKICLTVCDCLKILFDHGGYSSQCIFLFFSFFSSNIVVYFCLYDILPQKSSFFLIASC